MRSDQAAWFEFRFDQPEQAPAFLLVVCLWSNQLEGVEGIVVFFLEDAFAAPESKVFAGSPEAVYGAGISRFRESVDESDDVAGVKPIEGAAEFRCDWGVCRRENIGEGADLAEVKPPGAEGKKLSHLGVLMGGEDLFVAWGWGISDEAEDLEFAAAFVAFAAATERGPCGILGCEEVGFGVGRGRIASGCSRCESLNYGGIEAGESGGVHAVVEEGFPDDGEERGDDAFADGGGVVADFKLSVAVHAESEEVQEVVEIDFPVGFGVG